MLMNGNTIIPLRLTRVTNASIHVSRERPLYDLRKSEIIQQDYNYIVVGQKYRNIIYNSEFRTLSIKNKIQIGNNLFAIFVQPLRTLWLKNKPQSAQRQHGVH